MEEQVKKAEKPKAEKPKTVYAFPREGVTIEASSVEEALSILNSK